MHHLKGLQELAAEHFVSGRRILVCREQKIRTTSDGIEILSMQEFLDELWSGRLF